MAGAGTAHSFSSSRASACSLLAVSAGLATRVRVPLPLALHRDGSADPRTRLAVLERACDRRSSLEVRRED